MGYPNLLRRYLATFIDFWVMLFLLHTYAHSGFYHEEISKLPLWPLLIFVLYEPFLTRYLCTPGQYLMHFRVRMVSDHGRVPLWRGLVRVFTKYLLSWHSFLKMPRHPQRRAFHDILAGTVVLEARSAVVHDPPNNRWRGP
jgi:uncharacterized RDD family membrane protein YckC